MFVIIPCIRGWMEVYWMAAKIATVSNCVTNAHSTPLIDDNVTDVCYNTMY